MKQTWFIQTINIHILIFPIGGCKRCCLICNTLKLTYKWPENEDRSEIEVIVVTPTQNPITFIAVIFVFAPWPKFLELGRCISPGKYKLSTLFVINIFFKLEYWAAIFLFTTTIRKNPKRERKGMQVLQSVFPYWCNKSFYNILSTIFNC